MQSKSVYPVDLRFLPHSSSSSVCQSGCQHASPLEIQLFETQTIQCGPNTLNTGGLYKLVCAEI